jgi:putative copper export protein
MAPLDLLSETLHALAAMLWLGGAFFLAIVGAPVLARRAGVPPRGALSPARRALPCGRMDRHRSARHLGLANLAFRGVLDADTLSSAGFWQGRYGRTLAWKLAIVSVMVALAALHDFVIGPRASRLGADSPEARVARRRAAWLARLNAVLGVALVAVAVRLARGG